ncbi:23532_t:CDS:1 [Cetraspora pellucida]|uniref:23532_t:CDS:1 n=1 Tax=Cetraspora pellucida TaxID=1433469 RepID=A0A9N9A2J0_9GLOM|nr:23532_t:CDS:1 [Cetraspora pellucida]
MLSTILPLPAYQLCDHLKVVFVREEQPTKEQLKKVLGVRRNKIATALEWLVNYNNLYRKININKTILETLPENGILSALLTMIVIVDINPEIVKHYTGYMVDPINEDNMSNSIDHKNDIEQKYEKTIFETHNSINDLTELRNLSMIYDNNIFILEQECSLKLLGKMIQEITDYNSNAILMPHLNTPKNEYTDLTLLPATFPILFSYGISGHEDNYCKQYIPFKQYIKHLLQLNNPKFRQHHLFIFATFDML